MRSSRAGSAPRAAPPTCGIFRRATPADFDTLAVPTPPFSRNPAGSAVQTALSHPRAESCIGRARAPWRPGSVALRFAGRACRWSTRSSAERRAARSRNFRRRGRLSPRAKSRRGRAGLRPRSPPVGRPAFAPSAERGLRSGSGDAASAPLAPEEREPARRLWRTKLGLWCASSCPVLLSFKTNTGRSAGLPNGPE